MKKLVIIFCLTFIFLSGQPKNNFTLLNYFKGDYSAYTETAVLEDNIFLGSCYLNKGRIDDLDLLVGESMVIKNLEAGAVIKLLKANVVKTESLGSGAVVIYANSPLINKSVRISNQKVNLQIAVYADYSVIGWPLILGSF